MQASLIRWLLPAGLVAAYYVASSQPPPPLAPYSVQMHVHGSMSEGPGSMAGTNAQARKLGLNVLWWSDHDWRMAYHTYPTHFDFESATLTATRPREYAAGTDPTAVEGDTTAISLIPALTNGRVAEAAASTTTARASQGTYSFEVSARALRPGEAPSVSPEKPARQTGGDDDAAEGPARAARPAAYGDFQPFFYTLTAARQTAKRSLASQVDVTIALYPELEDARDGMAAVRFDLSQQPPDFAPGVLFYVATALSEQELKRIETPHVRFVKLPYEPGKWNQITMPLTDDARRLGLGGEDNSMVAVSFGVLTRGKTARAFFDDLRIAHRIDREGLRAEARKMAAALQKQLGVVNYVGQEFSYLAHLNPLGQNVPMIDYVKFPHGLAHRETAEFAHRYGAVVSLNHIFGTSRPPKGLDPEDPESVRNFEAKRIGDLIASHCYGADLLEVGYPRRVLPMTSFLRVWDALSAAGVYVTANGVSDTHTSTGGWFDGNNFVSWVWARSASQADLIEGFRDGNLYFGDLHRFKGRVRLTTADGHRMGHIVATAKPSHSVSFEINGLPVGARVRTVVNGQPATEFATDSPGVKRTAEIDTRARTFFRVEAYSPDGRPLVFSNAIHFVPAGEKVESGLARVTACR